MRKLKIDVRQEDIDQAVKSDSHHCMIADAIQRHVPSAKYIMVDLQSIRFSDVEKGERYMYMTPPIAQKAIIDFDHGNPTLTAFSFTVSMGHKVVMRCRQSRPKPGKRPLNKRTKKPLMPAREREFGLRAIK